VSPPRAEVLSRCAALALVVAGHAAWSAAQARPAPSETTHAVATQAGGTRADAPVADTAPPEAPPGSAQAPEQPRTSPGAVTSTIPAPADAGAAGHATTALKAWWLPLVLPVNLLAPGVGQLLRGDTAAGRRMLSLAGGLLAGALAGGVFLGATGASDVSAAVGVPLVVVGLGGFFSLGAIDAIGTFSDAREAFPEGVRADAWNARWRAGLSLQVAPSSPSADRPALGAFGQARFTRWLVTAEAGTLPGVDEWWLSAGGGARLVRYGEFSDAAGLWLETSVRHDAAGHLGFDATRWRVSLASTLPLGVVSERFGRVTSILRLGLDPTWVHYRATNTSSFELPLSGGFEVRWAMVDWLRAYAGYEHARDGLVGGNYLGFLGVLYAGLEVQLPANLVLDLRGQAGTPAAFFTSLEWRH